MRPSKKAEPFKIWLAKVGNERIEETYDPELAFDRAMRTYLNKGYSKEWIEKRSCACSFVSPRYYSTGCL